MRSLGGDLNPTTKRQDAYVTIREMQELVEQDSDIISGMKAGYYTLNCTLTWIHIDETQQRQMFYLACSSCRKKVAEEDHGYWCENCAKNYEAATPTYNFSCKIADFTGQINLSVLGEVGEEIMGMSCQKFYDEVHRDIEEVKAVRSN